MVEADPALTVVIPAAGWGTRLLPATKVIPKPLLPVQYKPAIQWAIEEVASAGARHAIVVLRPDMTILREFLTPLPATHPLAGQPALAELDALLSGMQVELVEQEQPRGLGHAILTCRPRLGHGPFAVILPDIVIPVGSPLPRLFELQRSRGGSWVALAAPSPETGGYGAVETAELGDGLHAVKRVHAKGAPKRPGHFRGVGRYILEPDFFTHLERDDSPGELDDGPALDGLARAGRLWGLTVEEPDAHLGVAPG